MFYPEKIIVFIEEIASNPMRALGRQKYMFFL